MPTNEHYDVVIIGSGAGGGTLAWKLAPSGKRILLLERGGYLPASATTGTRPRSFSRASTRPTRSGTTEGRRVHARAELLRRRQHQVLRRRSVPAAPRGLRGDHASRRRLPRLAALLPGLRAVVRGGRTPVLRPRRRGRGPDRRPPQQRLPVSGGAARAAHPAAARRPREARLASVAPAHRRPPRPGRPRRRRTRESVHPVRPGGRLPVRGGREGGFAGRLRRSRACLAPEPRARHRCEGRPARDGCTPAAR